MGPVSCSRLSYTSEIPAKQGERSPVKRLSEEPTTGARRSSGHFQRKPPCESNPPRVYRRTWRRTRFSCFARVTESWADGYAFLEPIHTRRHVSFFLKIVPHEVLVAERRVLRESVSLTTVGRIRPPFRWWSVYDPPVTLAFENLGVRWRIEPQPSWRIASTSTPVEQRTPPTLAKRENTIDTSISRRYAESRGPLGSDYRAYHFDAETSVVLLRYGILLDEGDSALNVRCAVCWFLCGIRTRLSACSVCRLFCSRRLQTACDECSSSCGASLEEGPTGDHFF